MIRTFLGISFIAWFSIVFMFSSQTGKESTQISNQVTRELLKMKDRVCVILEHYQETNEMMLKRN